MTNNLNILRDFTDVFEVKNKQKILCVGMCVLDIIHLIDKYPEEDSDIRLVFKYVNISV